MYDRYTNTSCCTGKLIYARTCMCWNLELNYVIMFHNFARNSMMGASDDLAQVHVIY